jgi:copper transport protein
VEEVSRRVLSRWLRRSALVVLTGLGLAVLTASAAGAHAELVKSEPAPTASLADPPNRIVLQFDEAVRIPTGGVRVINEAEQRLATASARSSEDATVQTVGLPKLRPGAYVVSWRAVSTDGHPVRGAFTFRVGETGDQRAVAALAEKLLSQGGGPVGIGIAFALLRFMTFASTLVLIGGLGYHRFVRGDGATPVDASLTLVRISTILSALSGVATVLLYGPYVGGYGFAGLSDGTLLDDTLGDRVGRAFVVKTVALVVLGVLLGRLLGTLRPDDPDAPSGNTRTPIADRPVDAVDVFAAVAAMTALLAEVFSGHGNTGRLPVAAGLFTIVHVAAAALWIGGLAFVGIDIRRSRATPPATAVVLATDVLRRFSRLALAAVTAVVATGVFASWRQVGSRAAATETTYGRLLLLKIALVAGLIALGAMARRLLTARTRVDAEAHRRLRASTGFEVVIGAVVVAVTSLLVNVAPARDTVAKPIGLQLTTATMHIDVTVDPARKGHNNIHIYALTPTGTPQAIQHAQLSATKQTRGTEPLEPLELHMFRAGPNHFQALNADLPLKGTWTLDIIVGVDEFTEEEATADITLR